MPKKFLNDDGETVEAYTKEEFEQTLKEKTKELKEGAGSEEFKTRLEELKKENAKLKEKETNFEKLRKKTEKLEEEGEKTRQLVHKKDLQEAIRNVVGDNEDLQEKVLNNYNSFKGEPETTKDMRQRVRNAALLATQGRTKKLSGKAISSGAGSPHIETPTKPKREIQDKQATKDVGSALGISSDRIDKYEKEGK